MRVLSLATILSLALISPLFANTTSGLKFVETADGKQRRDTRQLVQWTHTRLLFDRALKRVAVGQQATLEVEVLGEFEVLALAKSIGRTSVMVWYMDGSTETFLFSVSRDLSVLRRALYDVHQGIRLELAPDRAALVLRGKVPTMEYRLDAERVARNYLDAGRGSLDRDYASNRLATDLINNAVDDGRTTAAALRPSMAAVINLIRVATPPQTAEQKILEAAGHIAGADIQVRRIRRGDVDDDAIDTLVLSGRVANQVALMRVLSVAGKILRERSGDLSVDSLRAIADESGAMLQGRGGGARNRGGLPGLTGGTGDLGNEIQANLGRSKLVAVAGGRLLSMIEVDDLPQVRVSVQMHEVDRLQLKNWRPELSLLSNGYNSNGRFSVGGLQRRGVTTSAVENALQVIGGAMSNNLQVSSGAYAFDLLFSMLEEAGISKTLSRPTLTVLAGESAVFRAGGEVPVPRAFAPGGSELSGDNGTAQGVFSGTEFKAFGVELRVRAMVDENDDITLDINPSVSLPDNALTAQIAGSTGSKLSTAAFDVRSIDTSARLRDGQPLVIGGLVSRDLGNSRSSTPGLGDVPVLGRLAQSNISSDTSRELVIVVTPTIVRTPRHEVALWQYPTANELLHNTVRTERNSTEATSK